MVQAGQRLVAGRIPGERIATDVSTSDSSDFTDTEIEVQSVTAALVEGRTYTVVLDTSISGDTVDDEVGVRIREDAVSGSFVQNRRSYVSSSTSSFGDYVRVQGEYTATSTGDKTFIATATRISGAGTSSRHGSSSSPSYMYVDYIR